MTAGQPFRDCGEFTWYVHQERVLHVKFRWTVSGRYAARIAFSLGGQTATAVFKATLTDRGSWKFARRISRRAEVTARSASGRVLSRFEDTQRVTKVEPDALLYEEHSPALLSALIRRYDANVRGRQVFPAFVFPSAAAKLAIDFRSQECRLISGVPVHLRRFQLTSGPLEATVWADDKDRICLVELPAYHSEIVRVGYEALLERSMPAQVHVRRNLRVPMRDGVKLATDVYRPRGRGPFPVIVIRTPYKKEMEELKALYYARRGYMVAVQDVRGRFHSQGVWEPYVHESQDGHDAVEFFGRHSLSNGKVGMIGASYLAWTQWWAAVEEPPHLTTILPNVSPPDPYEIHYQQGVFFLAPAMAWVDLIESGAVGDISGEALERVMRKRYGALLRALPVIESDKAVIGKPVPYWREWTRHPAKDAYWCRIGFSDKLHRVRIPVFHQSGWFDYDGIGTKLNYCRVAAYGRCPQKLIIGPWGHTDQAHRKFGAFDFGPEALIDLQKTYLRWFDFWLKGVDTGIMREPPVDLFVLGSNRWIHSDTYPLPGTRYHKWYLAPGGKLERERPHRRRSQDRYVYDPGDPTPDPDFAIDSEAIASNGRRQPTRAAALRGRGDVLIYLTEPFVRPYTFVGPVSAVLYASSSAKDTDWHVRLFDVMGPGRLLRLAHGMVRARFRGGTGQPRLLTPGNVYRYEIDLNHIALTVQPGSRLRVEITSAAFPTCSRNLNTGGLNEEESDYLPAVQSIYCCERYPSHLKLPAISERKLLVVGANSKIQANSSKT